MSHCFGSLFFHNFQLCTERSWGQPGTEFSPAVSEMPTLMPGSHTLTIREEMKLFLQLPAPGSCSFPLASYLPLFLWQTDPFPHPWVTLMGLVSADEKFLKFTRDLLPSPTGKGEPKQRGSAPGFPLCISVADPKCCQQHKLLTPRVPLTAEGILEG